MQKDITMTNNRAHILNKASAKSSYFPNKEQEIFLCCKSGQGKAINCRNHALYLSLKVCDKKN